MRDAVISQYDRRLHVVGARGGGSSIVKVPGDVPPARVYFFQLFSLANGILLPILVDFNPGKGMLFGNFGQRNVKLR